ncbi:hypothetical protein ILYODFUR_010983 [Ilyodon furcidens]|uniref:Uncharacterized protein n=1 Tax=Ilyodon furcidens TaxID=33524 RepID=A0ABV0T8D1_9TELE
MRLNMCCFSAPRAILKQYSRGMTSVSSEGSTATLPFLRRGAPGGPLIPHSGTNRDAAPVSSAPVPFGRKLAAQRVRCVRLKGKGNEESDHNNKCGVLHLSTALSV